MSGYIGTAPVPQSTQTRQTFTATASQTSFATGGYQAGYLDVFLNGVKLVDGTDYTATNGSDVVLTTGAASGDTLEVVAYTAFEAANVTGATDFTVTGSFTSRGIDDNAASTAMTLDGSGNLLVGDTSATFNDNAKTVIRPSADNWTIKPAVAHAFNRTGGDGDILEFYRTASTKVGSVGAVGGDLWLGSSAASHAAIRFANGSMFPVSNTGGGSDGLVDIGDSLARFKDLYLSGGVYLGGTGSANKLDDVEFGTFNPTIAGSTSAGAPSSYTKREGRYAKMGHLVHVQITLGWSSHTGTGNMSIRDLPFLAVSGGWTGQSTLNVGYNSGLSRSTGRVMAIYVANGTSQANFTETAENGDIQGLAIDANVNEIIIAGTYYSQ